MPKMDDTNFELLLRQKQERRRASDLTELLMVSMQVKPSARYLIDMFNDTPHNTIQEALVVWVKKEIADYGWDVPNNELLVFLKKRFRAVFDNSIP